MPLNISPGFKARLMATFPTAFNGGVIYVYSGPQPTYPQQGPTGDLLAVVTPDGLPHTLGSPINGMAFTDGSAGYVVPPDGMQLRMTVTQGGVAGWARLMSFDDSLQYDLSALRIDCSVNDSTPGVPASFYLGNPTLTLNEVRQVGYFIYGIPPFGVPSP